jgi:hypothetical protein
MKIIYTGLESAGKSLLLAKVAKRLLKRNKKWRKKYGFLRPIYTNLLFSDDFIKGNEEYIKNWLDVREILELSGCDILWDEISSDFSALKKEPLSRKINRWLRQGAKQGVHIYATAQEFHDLHLDMRRRVSNCYNIKKIIGSSRGGENMPPVNKIWGLCTVTDIEIHPYNELEPKSKSIIPSFLIINKDLCSVFNTHQIIQASEEPLLEHVERKCERADCDFKRIIHR